jgi:transposase
VREWVILVGVTPCMKRLRVQKVLEAAKLKLKLASVASDVLGVSGRDLLAALWGGEPDPEALAERARGKWRAKRPALRRALVGRVKPHHLHLVLIRRILAPGPARLPGADQRGGAGGDHAQHSLAPFEQAVTLLDTLPSVGAVTAATSGAESGTDMRRFPAAQHLASWAGLGPGNKQSGGNRLSGKTTKGNRWLRAVLGEVAWSISRSPGTDLHAQYHRLARRRGTNRAIVAVAHSVVVIAYHILRDQQPSTDLYQSRRHVLRHPRHGAPPAPSCPAPRAARLHPHAHAQGGSLRQPVLQGFS